MPSRQDDHPAPGFTVSLDDTLGWVWKVNDRALSGRVNGGSDRQRCVAETWDMHSRGWPEQVSHG